MLHCVVHTKGLSSATDGVYLTGINALHTLKGHLSPMAGHHVKLALKAVQDASDSTINKAPITCSLRYSKYWTLGVYCVYYGRRCLDLASLGPSGGLKYAATVQEGTISAPLVSDIRFTSFNNATALVYTVRVIIPDSTPPVWWVDHRWPSGGSHQCRWATSGPPEVCFLGLTCSLQRRAAYDVLVSWFST